MTYILNQRSQYAAFDCPKKTNVYSRDIGYQGDLKISQANVKVQRSNRDERKLKKINTANPSKLNKIYFLILRLFFLKQENFSNFLSKIILIRKYSEK